MTFLLIFNQRVNLINSIKTAVAAIEIKLWRMQGLWPGYGVRIWRRLCIYRLYYIGYALGYGGCKGGWFDKDINRLMLFISFPFYYRCLKRMNGLCIVTFLFVVAFLKRNCKIISEITTEMTGWIEYSWSKDSLKKISSSCFKLIELFTQPTSSPLPNLTVGFSFTL